MSTLQHEYSGFYIDGDWRPSASTDTPYARSQDTLATTWSTVMLA